MSEQTIFSLNEAARITGRSKGTISKALSSGRLSYLSQEGGAYQIEASELFRVFPKETPKAGSGDQSETAEAAQETAVLRAKLDAAERLLQDREATIADLRERLDREGEERRKITAILTHQHETAAPSGNALGRLWAAFRGKA